MFVADQNNFRKTLSLWIGALIPTSFGMMLGWPTSAYPILMQQNFTRIPFVLDETSPVIGFLMEGNLLGVIFSSWLVMPCKTGVCLSFTLQITGWILMFFSNDMMWFFASRTTIGFANSYGMEQLKRYSADTCKARGICTYLPLGLNVGVTAVFVLREYIDVRQLALICSTVPTVGLLLFLLSSAAYEDILPAITKVSTGKVLAPKNIREVLRDETSKKYLALLFVLIFVQQFSGGPPLIVYNELIFETSENLYPKTCSVLYSLGFFTSMLVALTYANRVPRKLNLLVSALVCILCSSLMTVYYVLKAQLLSLSALFAWSPLVLLLCFNFFHTFSFATLPLLLLSENVPKSSLPVLGTFATVHFSVSAVVSTKTFRVLSGRFGIAAGYAFFVVVLSAGFFLILLFKDFTPKKGEWRKYILNPKEILRDKSEDKLTRL